MEKTKNLKKHVSLYFPDVMSKYIYSWNIYSFLYVLDIYVTRNGKNLKLKVKSEFSLSLGLILIYTILPYCVIIYYVSCSMSCRKCSK